ncbi:transmembrane protein, putative [Bodo saltans]|uniref:Transmembrane protein, putative n=1 Tax=Bodo saltans TaxID=75058 RepID=A0A0S4KKB8_BODSA|nr:transmembrane protein, putative [Bodo saltans]|eukprot:CUI14895.1 transmembrane protein, putative [Bodo saltans]
MNRSSSDKKTLFHDDVQLEDVDAHPFERFGGTQNEASSTSLGPSTTRMPKIAAPPPQLRVEIPTDGSPARKQPTTTTTATAKRSIFDAPQSGNLAPRSNANLNQSSSGLGVSSSVMMHTPTAPTAAHNGGNSFAAGTPNVLAAPKRQVMMINTELAVGHEKTLKNTLGRKTTVNSLSGGGAINHNTISFMEARTPRSGGSAPDDGVTSFNNNNTNEPATRASSKDGATVLSAANDAEEQMSRKQTPRLSSLKKFPKAQKEWMRVSRTAFQFCCIFSAILALIFCAVTTASGYWVVRSDTKASLTGWYELTTYGGMCVCDTNMEFGCSSLSNAFSQVGTLSGILIGSELLLIGMLLYEFSFYGIFGGPDYFTRLTLCAEVLGFATAILSLILYVMVYMQDNCGVRSYADSGYQLTWGVYVRGIEAACFFLMIILTADAGFNARGPPCSLLFVGVGVFALTCITSVSMSWMVSGGSNATYYGIWAHCDCSVNCSTRTDYSGLLQSTRSLVVIQSVIGMFTIFFILLRGVDNVGATLKFAEISGVAFVIVAMVGVGNLYRLDLNASCNIPGQSDDYQVGWAFYSMVGSAGIMCIFLVMNGLYMTRFYVTTLEDMILEFLPTDHPFYEWAQDFLKRQEEWLEQQKQTPEHVANSQNFIKGIIGKSAAPPPPNSDEERYKSGPFAAAGPRTFYQLFWWDELMSDGAIQAEELDEAFQEEEEQMAIRRAQTAQLDQQAGGKRQAWGAGGDEMQSDSALFSPAFAKVDKKKKFASDGAYVEDLK